MDMPSQGTIDSENGLLVKRPKKEYRRMVFVTLLVETMGVLFDYEFIQKNETPLLESIVSVIFIASMMCYIPWKIWRDFEGQTFMINQKGVTRIQHGKQGKCFRWDSFAAIEKHKIFIIKVGSEEYEAVLCSTHPIEVPMQPSGKRYLTWDYHLQKNNRDSVVELVLDKDQYAEFLSYIPEEIKESDIVKL